MFCNHCGAQNPDGATFCSSCGNSLAANSFQQRGQQRSSELIELERMIRYFSEMDSQYDEYDKLGAEIEKSAKGKHYSLLVWGIIVAVLGAFSATAVYSSSPGADKGLISFLFLIPGAAMIVGHVLYAKNYNNNVARARNRYDELTNELMQHYYNYGQCSVGAEYTNPANLSVIHDTIQSGRADTIKEAIRVLEEDVYRSNMQQYAAQTVKNTAAAARGAKASAVFNAANFFLK